MRCCSRLRLFFPVRQFGHGAEQRPAGFAEYSDALMQKIIVLDAESIRVRFQDGMEMEQIIPSCEFEG